MSSSRTALCIYGACVPSCGTGRVHRGIGRLGQAFFTPFRSAFVRRPSEASVARRPAVAANWPPLLPPPSSKPTPRRRSSNGDRPSSGQPMRPSARGAALSGRRSGQPACKGPEKQRAAIAVVPIILPACLDSAITSRSVGANSQQSRHPVCGPVPERPCRAAIHRQTTPIASFSGKQATAAPAASADEEDPAARIRTARGETAPSPPAPAPPKSLSPRTAAPDLTSPAHEGPVAQSPKQRLWVTNRRPSPRDIGVTVVSGASHTVSVTTAARPTVRGAIRPGSGEQRPAYSRIRPLLLSSWMMQADETLTTTVSAVTVPLRHDPNCPELHSASRI